MSIGQVLAGAIAGKMQYDQQKFHKEREKKRDALAQKQLENTKTMNQRLLDLMPKNSKEVLPSDDADYGKYKPQEFSEDGMPKVFENSASYTGYAKGNPDKQNPRTTMAEGGVVGYMYGGMVGSKNKKSYYADGGQIGHKTVHASGYYHNGMDGCPDSMMWQKENFKK
tara:strand:+ start:544 stop:1047 length:504 start_codon:yes stop_codon:yes gene_type:complete